MKKKIIALILAGTMALFICSCGNKEPDKPLHTTSPETKTIEEEATVSFADLTRLEFCFSSGAGSWETKLTIKADGSFSGEHLDAELGLTGEDYPLFHAD